MRNFRVRKGIVEIESKDPYMRSFLVPSDLGNCRVNVWRNDKNSRFTVGTALEHPTKGKTQLFRKGLTEKEVMELLKHPRRHTGKGYYQK